MARNKSAILTPAQQKTVDTVAALRTELKIQTSSLKDLTKAANTATKAQEKQQAAVDKLQAKLDKLSPTKPVVTAVSQPVAVAA